MAQAKLAEIESSVGLYRGFEHRIEPHRRVYLRGDAAPAGSSACPLDT